MTVKAEDHGVTGDGIGWRIEQLTEEDRDVVAGVLAKLHLLPDAAISAEWARRAAHRPGAGRQRVYRSCPKCGEAFSSRELRIHIPSCRSDK